MFLCIWTAVHLNLPEHKKAHEQRMRKVGWLVLGLIAPELVAWNAFEQRRKVKKLTRKMRMLYRRQHCIEEDVKIQPWHHSIGSVWSTVWRAGWLERGWQKTKVFFLFEAEDLAVPPIGKWPASKDRDAAELFWTDLHSWYVVMGGIVFDTSSACRPFLPNSRERIVLTTKGIRTLMKYWPHLIPNLSRGDIEDKSKSDGLTKLITCWQATWFCVQCICRLAQGLSMSLLELNVFGHAICALLIYFMWWTKPKDISEPTRIVGEESFSVAAGLCNGSPIGSPLLFNQGWRRIDLVLRPFTLYQGRDGSGTPLQCREYSPHTEYYPIRNLTKPFVLHLAHTHWHLEQSSHLDPDSTYVAIDAITANRLSLIRQPLQERTLYDFVRFRNRNWSIDLDFMDDILPRLQYLIGMTLACGLYGGLHATAWDAPFSSRLQELLWRTSSATVTSSGITCMIFLESFLLWDNLRDTLHHVSDTTHHGKILRHRARIHSRLRGTDHGFVWVCRFFICAGGLWYCFCRSFLVVESFVNVTHLSASDLGVPTWSSYVPHIS